MENHLDRFDRHCLEMTITLRDGIMGSSDPVQSSMTRVWKTYEKLWTALIKEGQDSGQFQNIGDPKMIAFGILGMCNWLARWYKPDKEVSIEQLIDTYFNLVSQGLNQNNGDRSDARRVGKECVSKFRYRWSPELKKNT